MDSVKNTHSDSNIWDDFIYSNYFRYRDENEFAVFGDTLTDEITPCCKCGGNDLLFYRKGSII